MRISDWSSDVCSSDLSPPRKGRRKPLIIFVGAIGRAIIPPREGRPVAALQRALQPPRLDEAHERLQLVAFGLRLLPRERPGRNCAADLPVLAEDLEAAIAGRHERRVDRKSVVSGKSVTVRVDLGGGRFLKKTK